MTLSELLAELNAVVAAHGDDEVLVWGRLGDLYSRIEPTGVELGTDHEKTSVWINAV